MENHKRPRSGQCVSNPRHRRRPRSIPESRFADKKDTLDEGTLGLEEDCGSLDDDYDCGPFQPAVRVEDVLHAFRPLARPWQQWLQSDIDLAIPVLRRRINFIGAGCSVESTSLCKLYMSQ